MTEIGKESQRHQQASSTTKTPNPKTKIKDKSKINPEKWKEIGKTSYAFIFFFYIFSRKKTLFGVLFPRGIPALEASLRRENSSWKLGIRPKPCSQQ